LNHIIKIIPHEITVVIAFVAVGLMWLNFIYWLRIFEKTTFYFDLINQTMKDMSWFFIIFVLIIFACGNAIFILNTNRVQGEAGDALYAESFSEGYGFLSAILNQFIVSIGQGDLENYSKDKFTKNRDLVWFVFIFVSIFA